MIAFATWFAILAGAQNEPPPEDAKAPAAEVEKKDETEEQRKARIGAGRVLFRDLLLLSILSILIMTLGLFMYISRNARRLKNLKKNKPVKYFDMTVGDGPDPPPHEPTAEERLGGKGSE